MRFLVNFQFIKISGYDIDENGTPKIYFILRDNTK